MKIIALASLVAAVSAAGTAGTTVYQNDVRHVHVEAAGLGFKNQQANNDHSAHSQLYVAETGENLLEVVSTENAVTLKYLDNEPLVMSKLEDNDNEIPHEQIRAMRSHPMFAHLKELSEAVGAKGMNGRSHPASHWLHSFAMTELTGLQKFQNHEDGHDVEALLEAEEAEHDAQAQAWRRRRRRRRRRRYNMLTMTGVKSITDSDQCGDPSTTCLGMCGKGCKCWIDVCGDCEWHRGCLEHDCECQCSGGSTARCLAIKATKHTCNYFGCASEYCGQTQFNTVKCSGLGGSDGVFTVSSTDDYPYSVIKYGWGPTIDLVMALG